MKRRALIQHVIRMVAVCLTGVMLLSGCGGEMDDSGGAAGQESSDMDWSSTDNQEDVGFDSTDSQSDVEIESDGSNSDNDSADDGDVHCGNGEADKEEPEEVCVQDNDNLTGSDITQSKQPRFEAAADETSGLAEKKMAERDYLDSCYSYEWPLEYESSEEYGQWNEKGFISVMKEPLSTFAADVDTASYSNLRRLIREGCDLVSIPEGAARIEEMVNYFSYDYKEPAGIEPFGVTTQISGCPWNDEAELLMIGLKTEDIDYAKAPPSNLVFLIDVSGSMSDYNKLPLLQESFGMLAENLRSKDRISIVTYAGDTRTVLEGARGSETQKIIGALNSLRAEGCTYGSKGIETAYDLAEKNYIQGGNNRIILATDGDLNVGLVSEEELENLISEKKESGIFLSVLGFGTGNIKDNKMETLADKGNGNYAYIDSLREARKVLVEEMSATLLTVCKDVKIQVEFNPSVVKEYRLLGYENRALDRQDFQDDTKDAGEIGAGHSMTALYELILKEPFNAGMSKKEIEDLKYSKEYRQEYGGSESGSAANKEEWLTVSIRYKRPAAQTSMLLSDPVGYESYSANPSEDFVFAAAVAEFGLLASHSRYQEDASMYHVNQTLNSMNLTDEYKEEFRELVQTVYRTVR